MRGREHEMGDRQTDWCGIGTEADSVVIKMGSRFKDKALNFPIHLHPSPYLLYLTGQELYLKVEQFLVYVERSPLKWRDIWLECFLDIFVFQRFSYGTRPKADPGYFGGITSS